MRAWWTRKQVFEPLVQSIQKRLQLMQHQLQRYPVNDELLHYMLDELRQMRQELNEWGAQPCSRLLLPSIHRLQIQITPIEQELYERLSESRTHGYIIGRYSKQEDVSHSAQ